jgi:L-Ala-D/L-Glu epimerase
MGQTLLAPLAAGPLLWTCPPNRQDIWLAGEFGASTAAAPALVQGSRGPAAVARMRPDRAAREAAMGTTEQVRAALDGVSVEAARSAEFERLCAGGLSAAELRDFLGNVVRTHYLSPHVLAFVYGLAPGPAATPLLANLREELGDADGAEAHPGLLRTLMAGAEFTPAETDVALAGAQERVRVLCARPLPFRAMREVGLAILLEMLAFEYFLAHHAGRVAAALADHYRLPPASLRWFDLHAEVDLRHAEEGLAIVEGYLAFHQLDEAAFARLTDVAFAVNPIVRAYFPAAAGAPAAATVSRSNPIATPSPSPVRIAVTAPSSVSVAVTAPSHPPPATAHLPRQLPPPARIETLDIFQLSIPFVHDVAHARATRAASDAVVVRLRDAEGHVGYGEGLPREYVTGEDVASMVACIRDRLAPRLFAARWAPDADLRAWLRARFPAWTRVPPGAGGALAWNAAFCAVELALWDLALRRAGQSLSAYLPPVRASICYDGVIPSDEPRQAAALARRFVGFGITRLKVKVGTPDDVARLDAIREAVGDGVRLRADANAVWSADEAVAMLRRLQPFALDAIEQPVAASDLAGLRRVRLETGLPVVADESLVRPADARALVAAEACDAFNIRISKCGGLTGALHIAGVALASGMAVQVGAQVGETALLSAAGRHLAAHLPHLVAVEGSFGRLLLSEDVTPDEVAFGYGGDAPLLAGPGLGIAVDDAALERLAVAYLRLDRPGR